jgi:hypothetical protein
MESEIWVHSWRIEAMLRDLVFYHRRKMQLLITLLYIRYDHALCHCCYHYVRRPLIKIPLLASIISVFVEFASRLILNRMASHVFC